MSSSTVVAADAAPTPATKRLRAAAGLARDVAVAVGICAALIAGVQFLLISTIGTSSEVVLDGAGTGVHRVAVADRFGVHWALGVTADSRRSNSDGALTTDQQLSAADGWVAACEVLETLEFFDLEGVAGCLAAQPTPSFGERHTGFSSGLAEALGSVTSLVDITGDVTVAATGQITILDPGHFAAEFGNTTGWVLAIGGAEQKLAAAESLDAHVLFVPTENLSEFEEAAASSGAAVRIVAVSTVLDAVVELCDISRTEFCGEVLARFGRQ